MVENVDERSDRELLTAHIEGDLAAFAQLTERYAGGLFGFLFRFVNDAAIADDLVQETFLQIHLAANSFDLSRPLKPWLYTIAANKARDLLRSRARRPERSINAPASPRTGDDAGAGLLDALESSETSASDEIDAQDRRDQVRSVIERLPEHLRLILMLGYYQQLPYAEIAEVLDIPVGTVKSRLHSAVGHFARLWRLQQKKPASADDRQ
jgi:RNA polymerase sigma-70 factor (ECF subfamily)